MPVELVELDLPDHVEVKTFPGWGRCVGMGDAAELMSLSRSTLEKLALREGVIKTAVHGKNRRWVPLDEIRRYFAERAPT